MKKIAPIETHDTTFLNSTTNKKLIRAEMTFIVLLGLAFKPSKTWLFRSIKSIYSGYLQDAPHSKDSKQKDAFHRVE